MALCLNNRQEAPQVSLLETSGSRATMRQKCHCRFLKYIACLFTGLIAALAFFCLQQECCRGCQHPAPVPENRTTVDWITPNAHLTAFSNSSGLSDNLPYLPWEHEKGDAYLQLFQYDAARNALVVPQKGRYSLYLHVTYRRPMGFPCRTGTLLKLEQQVLLWSDSYKADRVLMKARDDAICVDKESWTKSVHVTGIYSLEAGDKLMVKVQRLNFVELQEKSLYFGAFLIGRDTNI